MTLELAKGVKDLPPEEKIQKDKIVETITRVFELYGFAPLETPIIERYETLAAKFGAGTESDALKETFKFKDQGGRKLGLRFELTTSLARYVAMNPNLKLPFKRYEVGRAYRDGPIKLGRTREFWQFDGDIIGTNSLIAEAEGIAILDEVFKQLSFDFVIKVNNRKILNGILNQAEIQQQKEAMIVIDKLDKLGREGTSEELKKKGYSDKQIKEVFKLISPGISLSELKNKIFDPEGKEGINELLELADYLKIMKVKFEFDITLARGQAYYTGTVIEAFLKNSPLTSSIAGGGRYDKMIGGFIGNRDMPAFGVSFGLEPIQQAVKMQKMNVVKTTAKVLVIPINTIPASLEITQQLRAAGIPTDFAMSKKGVSKNLEYANVLKIPFVAIIGEDELKKSKILLKDMNSGTEQLLTTDKLVKKLR